jgi:hypothetical protein
MDKQEIIDFLKKELKVVVTVSRNFSTIHSVTTIVTIGDEVISNEVQKCDIGYHSSF